MAYVPKPTLLPAPMPLRCEQCQRHRPWDPKKKCAKPLPFEWRVHIHHSDRIKNGRYATITCSDSCRFWLGYEDQCSVPGCQEPYLGRGFCKGHQRIYYGR